MDPQAKLIVVDTFYRYSARYGRGSLFLNEDAGGQAKKIFMQK
jgi:hypothetical protein